MLGGTLTEAFNYFIQCDLFIMASSAFSIVPAIMKKNGLVIYVWNKYFTPIDDWIICNDINEDIKHVKTNIKKYIINQHIIKQVNNNNNNDNNNNNNNNDYDNNNDDDDDEKCDVDVKK